MDDKENIENKLRGVFSAAIAAYEINNPPKTTRQIGQVLGIPNNYNVDGIMNEPS